MSQHTRRHFLQIPGPTNVPDEVLRAISAPTIDHRGPEFGELGRDVLEALGPVFATEQPVVVYPSSGTGAWEAALVNTLSAGDTVLAFETGHFALLWQTMATTLGLQVRMVPGDWRHGVDPAVVAEELASDKDHEIKAVCVVHNETSTGVTSRVPEVRAAIDEAGLLAGWRRVLYHGHCHQKAEVGTAATIALLSRIPGVEVVEVDAGCSGMAGSFGFEAEHYDVSMQVGGDRLFPAVLGEPAGTVVAATGVSCRQQIHHGTERVARHPVELVRSALAPA